MRNPVVAAEIRERMLGKVAGLAVLGVSTLEAVMQDETAPAAARVAAAKFAIESSGIGLAAEALRAKLGGPGDHKPLSDYTIGELEAIVAAKESELEDAKGSDSAPMTDTDSE